MKIPGALEEMVAGLISDEQKKREEVEGILSKIHELTEPFFNPDAAVVPQPEEEPQAEVPVQVKLQNFTRMFQNKGLPQELALEKAEEVCGLRDPTK